MKNITLTLAENRRLKKAKTYLIKESNPSFEGQTKANNVLIELAKKYKVDTQVISDLMPVN